MTSFRAEECGQDGSLTFDKACGQINCMKLGKDGNLAEACAHVLFLQLVLLLLPLLLLLVLLVLQLLLLLLLCILWLMLLAPTFYTPLI